MVVRSVVVGWASCRPAWHHDAVDVGDVVPEFEALDQHGTIVRLVDLLELGPVVLFFYPKAMTPG